MEIVDCFEVYNEQQMNVHAAEARDYNVII